MCSTYTVYLYIYTHRQKIVLAANTRFIKKKQTPNNSHHELSLVSTPPHRHPLSIIIYKSHARCTSVIVPPAMIFFSAPKPRLDRYALLFSRNVSGPYTKQPSNHAKVCTPEPWYVYMHNTCTTSPGYWFYDAMCLGVEGTTAIGHEWRVVVCMWCVYECVCNIRTLIHTLIPIVLRFNVLLSPSACYIMSLLCIARVSSRLISRVEFSGWTSGRTRPCPVVKIKLFGGNATRISSQRNRSVQTNTVSGI